MKRTTLSSVFLRFYKNTFLMIYSDIIDYKTADHTKNHSLRCIPFISKVKQET